ncbi:F-type H+-transporting ATPase subunit delta [Mumia flava]|uniref:ATP synthase subunit delta n=1 Tax=Mumia flava TaxID=1348852 RepID=A0A0B2BN33_9ACTN|nr:F0F1 ATP synthase subunit delta [Mumia flava]PJJ56450.1 F-type H+-transporting ATPase subunit delta [Mumia flava]
MRGVSAASLESVLESVGGATADGADGVAVGQEVFAVVAALDANPVLRRVLSDPATEQDAKAGLARSLFGPHVGEGALRIVVVAASARWSSARDVADALEQAGVQAVLGQAERAGALETVADELFSFSTVVTGDVELRQALNDRTAPVDARADLAGRLVDGKVDAASAALARQAAAGRHRGFEQTLSDFGSAAVEREGRLSATVTSAYPLETAERERLAAVLGRKYGRDVHVDVHVDPAVIGGLSVDIAGERIDATVATKLAEARRGLVG